MFGIKTFVTGTMVGAAAGLFAANYHLVHAPEGVLIVPRTNQPPLRSTYVDVRSWSAAMWERYPEVTGAIVRDGRGDLIAEEALEELYQTLPELPGLNEQARQATQRSDLARAVRGKAEQGLNSLLDRVPIQFADEAVPAPRDAAGGQLPLAGELTSYVPRAGAARSTAADSPAPSLRTRPSGGSASATEQADPAAAGKWSSSAILDEAAVPEASSLVDQGRDQVRSTLGAMQNRIREIVPDDWDAEVPEEPQAGTTAPAAVAAEAAQAVAAGQNGGVAGSSAGTTIPGAVQTDQEWLRRAFKDLIPAGPATHNAAK